MRLRLELHHSTPGARHLPERSLSRLGAVRSLLVDRLGAVIAGNTSMAVVLGLRPTAAFVRADGTRLAAGGDRRWAEGNGTDGGVDRTPAAGLVLDERDADADHPLVAGRLAMLRFGARARRRLRQSAQAAAVGAGRRTGTRSSRPASFRGEKTVEESRRGADSSHGFDLPLPGGRTVGGAGNVIAARRAAKEWS